jgi:hypothetical protein
MELSKKDMIEINKSCPYGQGIFVQPNYIPVDVKEPVIYMMWVIGGLTGGSCWGDAHRNREAEAKPKFKALDLVLRRLKPDISFLQFREIEELIHTNEELNREYYGNSTEYKVEYIILSELISMLEKFNNG